MKRTKTILTSLTLAACTAFGCASDLDSESATLERLNQSGDEDDGYADDAGSRVLDAGRVRSADAGADAGDAGDGGDAGDVDLAEGDDDDRDWQGATADEGEDDGRGCRWGETLRRRFRRGQGPALDGGLGIPGFGGFGRDRGRERGDVGDARERGDESDAPSAPQAERVRD
ncbi:MAG: hypothetical protein ABW252_09110 [Polyangiales bacterium]